MAFKIKQIFGLSNELESRKQSFNFPGENLDDGDVFNHGLNTTKIDVKFFTNNRPALNTDWEVIDVNNIKYYGPTITADIFITKRA